MIADAVINEAPSATRCTDVMEFLRILHPDGVFEVRILNTPDRKGGSYKKTASGYFTKHDLAAQMVEKWSKVEPPGIYCTINPTDNALLARSANQPTFPAKNTTTDEDINRRRWILIDIDPIRKPGVSATDAESRKAALKAREIRDWLSDRGWPMPLRMVSGNGSYLLYRVELPNDGPAALLVKAFIDAIADRFTDDHVDIDRTVFNAARIAKIGGTWARKGCNLVGEDGIEDRPHRQSWFVRPDGEIEAVDRDLIQSVIDAAVSIEIDTKPSHDKPTTDLSRVAVIDAADDPADQAVVDACRKYVLGLDESIEGQKGSNKVFRIACECGRFGLNELQSWEVIQAYNREQCKPPWSEKELRKKLSDGIRTVKQGGEFAKYQKDGPPKGVRIRQKTGMMVADFVQTYPERGEEVISGLLRRGELLNIIGAPKVGKSWFIYSLAYCLATGHRWFERPVRPCRVLFIDNELQHKELSFRLRVVADKLDIDLQSINGQMVVECLRGTRLDLDGIEELIYLDYADDQFDVIFLDAFYRILPAGVDENNNAQMTEIYNRLDAIAMAKDACVILNHHSSKGDQSFKGITDVGAGAGAITRATDSHIIIRPHEQEDCAVLEGVCRSNLKPKPQTICFEFPRWELKDIEPVLRRPKSAAELRQEKLNDEADAKIREILTAADDWMATTAIRKQSGMGLPRVEATLQRMAGAGELETETQENPSNKKKTIDVFRVNKNYQAEKFLFSEFKGYAEGYA